ncbi:MAG: RlmE family RNA methyltransferase [Rickettsiales bacterium]|jgi:23S rRNA (uridine2552-2'-O)-methyltransferase|nr:RlmE family RNA methyltransferase [Rickettsiales bacterium]
MTFKTPHENLKTAKGRKVSSTNWLQRHINDKFVILATKNGYRSRASFKILEIDDKFKIFKKDQKVLDLGSTPGGWSQVIVKKVGLNNVIALDILEMEELRGVKFIQSDFLLPNATEKIGTDFDVVMSDMAANTTGNKGIDHLRTMNLVEKAFEFAITVLKKDGVFITKIFQGAGEPEFFNGLKKYFTGVKHFKPESSRKESVEIYIVAQGFKK